MNSRLLVLAAAVLLFAAALNLPAATSPTPVRLMPLGDSTTAGSYGAGKDGVGGYHGAGPTLRGSEAAG